MEAEPFGFQKKLLNQSLENLDEQLEMKFSFFGHYDEPDYVKTFMRKELAV